MCAQVFKVVSACVLYVGWGCMSGLKCVMGQSKDGIKNPYHVFIQQRGDQGPAVSPSGATAPLRTTVFLSSFFPNPHLYVPESFCR